MVKKFKRQCTHFFISPWKWHKFFSKSALKMIEKTIQQSESQHSGELRFVIESKLTFAQINQNLSSWQRALAVFSNTQVWDTEENSGVLIYLLLAERTVHIIADRGINKQVSQTQWDDIAFMMQQAFQQKDFQQGSLIGIEKITALLIEHFPARINNPNELSNTPIVL